jgi:signal recognition particle subunit SRP19
LVSKRDGQYIIYPQYFDSRLTRGQGRRVPRDTAVKAPSAADVFHAARAAGFDPEMDPEHHHPAHWNERAGRVLIPVDNVEGTKEGLIRVIARHLKQGGAAKGGSSAHPGEDED